MEGTVITVENKNYVTWVNFYMEFANKLLPYKNNRKALIEKIKFAYNTIGMTLLKLEKDNNVIDIDPFTIFGLFNKGITNANRITIIRGLAKELAVDASIPELFDGIPVLNNMKATYYSFIGDREEDDIENLWRVFASALEYANYHSESSKNDFIKSYNVTLQK